MKRERLTITLRSDILKRLDREIDGKIIRNRSHAIESFLTESLKGDIIRKAIILGGGQGVEFDGKTISKVLLPLRDGRTLLEHNIETLKKLGITDFIFSLGSVGQGIRDVLGDGSAYGIKTIYFDRDFENASAMRQARTLLEETFLMMNGDILLEDIDLEDMHSFHKSNNSKATLLITTVDDPNTLGTIYMKGSLITRFYSQPTQEEQYPSHIINGGVYFIEPEVCQMVTPETASLETEIFPALAKEKSLYGYAIDSPWIHLHDLEKYQTFLNTNKK